MNPARSVPPSRRAGAALVLAAAALVAGCSAAATPTPSFQPASSAAPGASTPPGATTPAPSPTSGRPSDLPIGTPPFATIDPGAPPIVGEVPAEIMAAARADLGGRVTTSEAATAEVVRAEAVAWPDGSLGCRVPGELYPQVVTPGYWIVLSVGGTQYDYRATDTGMVRLCERPLKTNPGG